MLRQDGFRKFIFITQRATIALSAFQAFGENEWAFLFRAASDLLLMVHDS